jgi:hypothetical protein
LDESQEKDEGREVVQHKAQLIIMGSVQKQGVEQLEVWALTSKQPSLRMVLAIAAEQGMHIHHMDIKAFFLNVELEDNVFIRLPPNVERGGDGAVYKLKKAVFGLKQAPRAWCNKLNEHLAGLGYKQYEADPALYFQFVNGQLEVIFTHVDDLLIAAAYLTKERWMKEKLKTLIDIKDGSCYLLPGHGDQ